MSATTKIEWCDMTFNPWIGCTKVSAGCANCYAENETFARVQRSRGREMWGAGKPRHLTAKGSWRKPLIWNRNARIMQHGWQEGIKICGSEAYAIERGFLKPVRPRVFCGSMMDWLDDEVPIEWLAELLNLVRKCSDLYWQLLTKRPENYEKRIEACLDMLEAHPHWGDLSNDCDTVRLRNWLADWFVLRKAPDNVWIGTTVENQEMANKRIPELLKIPSEVRFLSCEPLLENIDIFTLRNSGIGPVHVAKNIDWVICGGESGPNARPMHPDWARSLRGQCASVGIPFMFKQWGNHIPADQTSCPNGPGFKWVTDDGEVHTPMFFASTKRLPFARIGKKRAGRLLDGVEHNEFPGGPR